MNRLHFGVVVALIVLGLSGCEKAKVTNQASADAFVKAIKNAQGTTVYAVVHSVFSYNKMTSVKVTAPDGTSIQLTDPEQTGMSYYNVPVDADYSATQPVAGNYTYSVTFNDGEVIAYSNSLTSSVLAPANITLLTKSANGDSVYIAWDAIANVGAYQLTVKKGTYQVYYQRPFVDNSVPLKQNLKLGISLANFSSNSTGTYTFSLDGILYESTAYDYVQAISTITKDIAF